MSYLNERIRAVLDDASEARAIQFKGAWRSWGELARLVHGLDAEFERLGLPPGAAVGGLLRNRPEQVAAMIGVVSGGFCLVTLNALLPDDKLAADIATARCPVLVAEASDWAREPVRAAAKAAGAAGLSLTGDPARPVEIVAGLEDVGPGPHREPQPQVAILMLTSGTTGAPKRVPLRRAVVEQQLLEAAGGQRYNDASERPPPRSGASIMSGSVVHIGGVWGVLGAAISGSPMCLLEKFNVEEWRRAVVEHRPRAGGLPPAALRMVLDANLPREDLSSLVSLGAGTAGVPPELVDEFLARYDLPVLANYGATEFAGGVASWSLNAFRQYWTTKRGAVGRVHKTMAARVVDAETGEELPLGEEGLLELKGFAAGDGESWVRTTDRAVLDADRFLWIRGRADNAINRGGFKVQPDEVAAVLQSHPAVREASVVGLADRRLGEVPAAAIVLRDGVRKPSEAELAELVRGKLMAYCAPVAFRFVDELPRTPSMKVSTPAVRELFA
ncbi:MAG: Acyl-CoA synthetase (AMP-forming)/AMP-acid ligase [Phenylobacterium sp.]|nr:Acyl-CoA synthetase (AMP-forming)/AMP-acid ligase [Phenylobacterium sp.]